MHGLIAAVALALSGPLQAAAGPRLVDVDGRIWSPLAPPPGAVHVAIFVEPDCPISNRYAPEIARIAAAYRGRGVTTFLVYADPGLDANRARGHRRDFYPAADIPALVDRGFALADAAGATITPEAVVYTAAGRVYRGRIDNLYETLVRTRREATERTLRDALDAVLAGRPVPAAETQAVGCYIERKR